MLISYQFAGCLLADEMSLDEGVTFDRNSFKVIGVVDLGHHTPYTERNKAGDHALVLMFQPFRGQWVQVIGTFLSAGAVKGALLEKLILEAIVLLENAGYLVDRVTTDGAT